MPRPDEYGYVDFYPPLRIGSAEYEKAWALIGLLGFDHVLHYTCGVGHLKCFGFENKRQAIKFKLRF